MYDAVKMDEVLWVVASLFARGFVHGCTGNIFFVSVIKVTSFLGTNLIIPPRRIAIQPSFPV